MEFNLIRETARRYGLGGLAAITAMLAPAAIAGCADETLGGNQPVESQQYDSFETDQSASPAQLDCPVEALSDDPNGC